MNKEAELSRDYLYDKINLLEEENRILRELESCRSIIVELKNEILAERKERMALKMEIIRLKEAHRVIFDKKRVRNKRFDDDLATELSKRHD